MNAAVARLPDDDTVLCVIGLGQSWMQGGNLDALDPIATPTAEHPGFALQLNAPAMPRSGWAAALEDLHEREAADRARERPLSGFADAFERAMATRFGRRARLLMVTATRGGSTLEGGRIPDDGLMRGSMAYGWMMEQIRQAESLVRAGGGRLVVISIIAAHGEQDAALGISGESFARGWRRLREQADEDLCRITGQSEPILLHTYQTAAVDRRAFRSSGGGAAAQIPIWQLLMADLDPLCRCVGPVYWAHSRPGDVAHADNRSLRRIGLQFGRHVFGDVFGGGTGPLRIAACAWRGERVLRVTYNREIALETDDGLVNVSTLGPGLGYALEWSGGAVPGITGVQAPQEDPRSLEILLDRPALCGQGRLLVATSPTGRGVGREWGARTGVRSREPLEIDPQDRFILYDWACVEAYDLPCWPGGEAEAAGQARAPNTGFRSPDRSRIPPRPTRPRSGALGGRSGPGR